MRSLIKSTIFSFLFLFFILESSWGQRYDLSEVPEEFAPGVQAMMDATNNEDAKLIGQNFSAAWSGAGFSAQQKQQIIAISQKMLQKNYKGLPQFYHYFAALSYAVDLANIPGNVLNNLLSSLDKSVDSYNNKEFTKILSTLHTFFKQSKLYHSNFNRLYVEGGSYDFDFVAFEQPEPENLLPQEQKNDFNDWDNQPATDDAWDTGWETPSEKETTSPDDGWNTGSEGWNTAEDAWGNDENVSSEPDDTSVGLFDALTQVTPQPPVSGMVMTFDNVTFIVASTYDSVALKNTEGSLMLYKDLFVGKGGKFDWSSTGLEPNEVYVEFDEYNFEIHNPYISAEKVELNYSGKIKEPVEGIFEYDSKSHSSPSDADYPRFKSYSNDVKVNNLAGEGFTYKGGFSLRGSKIIGASVIPGPSFIEMRKDNKKLFYTRSNYFSFGDSTIDASNASIRIYHQRDSIYHPSIRFRYYPQSEKLVIRKEKGGFKDTPFSSTYYNMDIYADLIRWDLNADSLDISILTARNQIPAIFESKEYFNDNRLTRLSGLYGFNPLLMAYSYARKKRSERFYYLDMADDLKQNPKLVQNAMKDLHQKGYIDFNPLNGEVILKDKATHYFFSKYNKKDYDDLLIPSLTDAHPNATINLQNQEMQVRGIEQFYISKALNVYILPEQSAITLLDDRDFKFNGQLFAGNFEFVGKDFTFRYDSFLVDLQQIDSIRFYIEVKDEKTNQIKRQLVDNKLVAFDSRNEALSGLSTELEGTKGTLYINKPDNKSGRQQFPNYPSFDAQRGAVVYFNNENVLDSAYDESVYFVIPPFQIDSLSSADPAAIGFNGRFISGDIFPDFEETLHIMPDNSLGFNHKIPEDGYNLYQGTGKVYNQLLLNQNGLQVNGNIDYLTSTLESDQFTFYLDSVKAVGSNALVRAGDLGPASFPDVSVEQFEMLWLPREDSMYVKNIDLPFQYYNSTASLYGTTVINKNGLYGSGKLFTRGSESESEEFTFKENDYLARHAKFEIKSDNPKKPALAGDDVRLYFDLTNNIAEINPEIEGVAAINFPYAQYKTSISKAVWNLENKTVTMTKPEDVDIANSYFYTTRKELDSLAFSATAAEYDISNLELNISGIPYIKVADAKITPENNKVLILENAKLGQLKNTTIVIDTLNEYHTLVDGTVDILSRNKFIGNATYQFVNAESDTFNIDFRRFDLTEDESQRRGKKLYTVSGGSVTNEDNLEISPGMIFKGEAKMYAIKKPLELDGFVKLDFQKIPDYNTWIKYYSGNAERQEVRFDFATSVTDRNEPLTAGLHFHNRTDSLYATFVTDRLTPGDLDFFTPGGMLSYNQQKDLFQIVDTLKTSGVNYSGKVFTYNENTGDVTFEGPVKFMDNTETVTLHSSGLGKGNINTGIFDINSFLAFNFDIPNEALTSMSTDIFDIVERLGAAEAHQDQTTLLYKASEIVGENNAKEYERRNKEEYMPLWGVSNQLVQSLVLSEVNLTWSPENKAWYSTGKLGLSNILKQDINAMLDGFLEIRRTPNGTMFNIFIQASPVAWYHFSYMENRLVVSSGNDDFNEVVAGKTNVNKAKLGEYVFVPGDIAEALSYVNRFRKVYLGLDDPYNMSVAAQEPKTTEDLLPQEVEEKEITNETEGF
ncbi:MAG: hypothetical protein ACNS62_08295 [Candidatus Cyclobacteriaceae bacterium M3_2C_046]